jgi:hypothetical protein
VAKSGHHHRRRRQMRRCCCPPPERLSTPPTTLWHRSAPRTRPSRTRPGEGDPDERTLSSSSRVLEEEQFFIWATNAGNNSQLMSRIHQTQPNFSASFFDTVSQLNPLLHLHSTASAPTTPYVTLRTRSSSHTRGRTRRRRISETRRRQLKALHKIGAYKIRAPSTYVPFHYETSQIRHLLYLKRGMPKTTKVFCCGFFAISVAHSQRSATSSPSARSPPYVSLLLPTLLIFDDHLHTFCHRIFFSRRSFPSPSSGSATFAFCTFVSFNSTRLVTAPFDALFIRPWSGSTTFAFRTFVSITSTRPFAAPFDTRFHSPLVRIGHFRLPYLHASQCGQRREGRMSLTFITKLFYFATKGKFVVVLCSIIMSFIKVYRDIVV